MELYTGYIVKNDETNPYSVWIPAKNGGVLFKFFKCFGINTGTFNNIDFATIQAGAEKCYMIIEPTAQGPYLYDVSSGLATIEENNPSPDFNTVRDVKNMKNISNIYSAPCDNSYVSSPHSLPAVNGLQIFHPNSMAGTYINTYTNAPGGHHTTLDIGTKVLVAYPDGRGIGYIIGQIPYADETSKIIKNILN